MQTLNDALPVAHLAKIPLGAEHLCKERRRTSTEDYLNFQGVGPQSYGIFFQECTYDARNHVTNSSASIQWAPKEKKLGAQCLER